MAQRIRRLTSNQKIGGSNPFVVDILFYTKESSYKGCQNKGQHLAAEHVTDTIDKIHGRMAQRIRRLTSNQKIGGSNPSMVEFFLQRKLLRNRVYTRDNTWQQTKKQIQLIDRMHGRMAQRIRRLTSNQKIGGSNPSVVDFFLERKQLLRNRVYTRDNTWQLNKQHTID